MTCEEKEQREKGAALPRISAHHISPTSTRDHEHVIPQQRNPGFRSDRRPGGLRDKPRHTGFSPSKVMTQPRGQGHSALPPPSRSSLPTERLMGTPHRNHGKTEKVIGGAHPGQRHRRVSAPPPPLGKRSQSELRSEAGWHGPWLCHQTHRKLGSGCVCLSSPFWKIGTTETTACGLQHKRSIGQA